MTACRRAVAVRGAAPHVLHVRLVREGVASGELRADLDAERMADVVRMLHMAFVDHLLNPEWFDASDDRLVDAGIAVLCNGIAAGTSR